MGVGIRKGVDGFDEDDFVYDVFATDEKTAKVYRNRVPDQQLTFALAVMVHDIDSLKDDIHEDPPYSFGKAYVCTIPAEDGGAFQNPQHYDWLILEK